MKEKFKHVFARVKDHLWGPMGSVVFHVVLFAVILQFATSSSIDKSPKVDVVIMQPESTKLEDLDKTIDKEIEKVEAPDVVAPPADVPVIADAQPEAIGPGPGGTGVGSGQGTGIGSSDGAGTGFQLSAVRGPLIMKGLFGSAYGGRAAGGRAAAMKAYKAPAGADDAVLRALRWLKRTQKDTGTWDGEEPSAMAGFALLCFLAHGETTSSPEFGQTVEKGLKFLISTQGDKSSFSGNAYAHGIATYAMCEAFAMTKNMEVKGSAEKGLQVLMDGQQDPGGWNYGYEKKDRWDTSVSGWQIQALKAGKLSGCQNEGLERAIEKSAIFLRTISFNPANGSFSYSGNGPNVGGGGSWTMTGVGCLCLQLLGYSREPEVKAGLQFLDTQVCQWKQGPEPKNPVYGWYYCTQAKFQDGGARWDAWNKQFSKTIMDAQLEDGHWEGGEWGKQTYTTCLCCLMLEVYYRYLPTYKKVEDVAPPKATSDDDVVIDVG